MGERRRQEIGGGLARKAKTHAVPGNGEAVLDRPAVRFDRFLEAFLQPPEHRRRRRVGG